MEDTVKAKAREASLANLKQNQTENAEWEKFPTRRATDELGAMAGVSGKTYTHAAAVIESAPAPVVEAAKRTRGGQAGNMNAQKQSPHFGDFESNPRPVKVSHQIAAQIGVGKNTVERARIFVKGIFTTMNESFTVNGTQDVKPHHTLSK